MRNFVALTFAATFFFSFCQAQPFSLDNILGEIQQLESKNDPKCYATASRLEDFMFGTPLTDKARFEKNALQQTLSELIWQVSANAQDQTSIPIDQAAIDTAITPFFKVSKTDNGHFEIAFDKQRSITIHETDYRQYASIAYALRALLAVQQEQMLVDNMLPVLTPGAVEQISFYVSLYTLAVLKVADNQARLNDEYQLTESNLTQVWQSLAPELLNAQRINKQRINKKQQAKQQQVLNQQANNSTRADFVLINKIIEQKVASYAQYNKINQHLFFRNMQVYFARVSWPQDKQEGTQFKSQFTETLIDFAKSLYYLSEQTAHKQQHKFVEESDVNAAMELFIPHQINEYEDAIFFPNLPASEQVRIESYDMDAFRDSGLHWRYLQYAIKDDDFKGALEPTPFAAELIAENIAQFGVLTLRVAGEISIKTSDRLSLVAFEQGLKSIQRKIDAHHLIASKLTSKADKNARNIASSTSKIQVDADQQGKFFSDITEATGVAFEHRTSSWLNRLLRSYLPNKNGSVSINIPPAFGGGGVAAGDINNDGFDDLLMLSGAGNKLYLNKGSSFEDITMASGIDSWRRASDNLPGEPRQPLIADLDNDGLQDIVIIYVDDKHRVYRNLGNMKFADVTDRSGLGGPSFVGGPATVFDYDNDGLLDIFITNFGDYLNGQLPALKRRNTNAQPDKLFKNVGNFVFKDVSKGSGIENLGWGQAATHTDLNGDGWQDLIVGNDFGVNAYYLNQKDGTFVDVAPQIGTDKPSYTMSIGLADLNQDEAPDVYISNIVTMNKDQKYVLPTEDTRMAFNPEKMAHMRVVEANDLFISTRSGSNSLPEYQLSQSVGRGYSSTGWAWDADFFDFDNDTDDDLYVLNGMNEFNVYSSKNPYYSDPLKNKKMDVVIPVDFKEKNVFFVNQGGKLNNFSKESGVDILSNSRSAVYLDLENDGDLDIVLNNYHEAAVVYRNNAERNGNHWLKVKLIGAPDKGVNRDAIGARVILTTQSGQTVWREVSGSIGYMSVHPKTLHFGVAKDKQADLKVIWPNGKVQLIKQIAVNQSIQVSYDIQ